MDTSQLLVSAAATLGLVVVALMAVVPLAMERGPDDERTRRRPRARRRPVV